MVSVKLYAISRFDELRTFTAGDTERIATKLSEVFSSHLADPDSASRVVSVLATITASVMKGLFPSAQTKNLFIVVGSVSVQEGLLCQGPGALWLDLILPLNPTHPDRSPISRRIIKTAIKERGLARQTLDLCHKSMY